MSQAGTTNAQKRGVRWGWIISGLIVLVIVASFFLKGMEGSVQYYMTVSEYKSQQSNYLGKKIKLAGKVKAESLVKSGDNYKFIVEDMGSEIAVSFRGLAPDTFKEGVDVVVEGRGELGESFKAKNLMAKCASKYEAGGLPPLESMRGKSKI
jgi:cytochrome c-type biogenesis protein CcmE